MIGIGINLWAKGGITLSAPTVTITEVSVAQVGTDLNIETVATGAVTGDTVQYSIAPAAGGPVTTSGQYTWPSTLIEDVNIPVGSYVVTVLVGDSAPTTSLPFSIVNPAPVLSSVTASASGGDVTWGVTSDTSGGTLSAAIRPSSGSVGTVAQIIAGTGGDYTAGSTDATPTADANNAGTFTGLSAGTYVVDLVHVDAAESAIVSSGEVTVASATIPTVAFLNGFAQANTNYPSSSRTFDLTDVSAGDDLWIGVNGLLNGSINGNATLSLAGAPATLIASSQTSAGCAVFRIACPSAAAGNAAASVLFAVDTIGALGKWHAGCWKAEDVTSFAVYSDVQANASGPIDVSGNTGAGAALATAAIRNGQITGATGLSINSNIAVDAQRSFGYFSATTTPATPRTMQIVHTATADPVVGICIALS